MPAYDDLGLIHLYLGEALRTDDCAFTDRNISTIAAHLRRIATHRHDEEVIAGDEAPDAPGLGVSASVDGAFVDNSTIHYRVAKVVDGFESPASTAVSVTTPETLPVPATPTAAVSATSGGSLAAGVYQYAIAAYRDHTTLESAPSASASVNLGVPNGNDQIVTITLPGLVGGVTGYNIYRRSPGSTTFNFLASQPSATPYVDDGSVTASAERLIPFEDHSAYNAIEVTLDALDPGEKWRLYRTSLEEEWGASFLVELESGFTSPYVDTGGATGDGSPTTAVISFTNPGKILLESEVTGVLPPENGGRLAPPAALPAAVWVGPAAIAGDTIEIPEGEAVFVPFALDAAQTLDAIRVGVSVAGDAGAKVMLYLAEGHVEPGAIVASVELDVDATGDLVADLTPDEVVVAARYWLGVHNHTATLGPATFHAYADTVHLAPIDLPAPTAVAGSSGLIGVAGTTAIVTAVGLTLAPVVSAPVVQARTA
jgi:hypothetical protein